MQKPREIALPTPAGKKKKERTPRGIQCLDRAEALNIASGRPSRVNLLNVLSKIAHYEDECSKNDDKTTHIHTHAFEVSKRIQRCKNI